MVYVDEVTVVESSCSRSPLKSLFSLGMETYPTNTGRSQIQIHNWQVCSTEHQFRLNQFYGIIIVCVNDNLVHLNKEFILKYQTWRRIHNFYLAQTQ